MKRIVHVCIGVDISEWNTLEKKVRCHNNDLATPDVDDGRTNTWIDNDFCTYSGFEPS